MHARKRISDVVLEGLSGDGLARRLPSPKPREIRGIHGCKCHFNNGLHFAKLSDIPDFVGYPMLRKRCRRVRNRELERQERLRYQLLEQLYLLTGDDPGKAAVATDIELELGLPLEEVGPLAKELVRLGYLSEYGEGVRYVITDQGRDYLRQGAWRRRSIRH
jgi:hypothetical protein